MFVAIIIMISFPISKYFKNKLKKFKIIKNNLKEEDIWFSYYNSTEITFF
jgi:hypothetical protein